MTQLWKRPGTRLLLALGILLLLTFALAYWWLGNLAHEIAGLVLLVVLLRHLLNNLTWWKQLGRGRWTARRALTTALTLCLAVDLLALAGTSIVISESLFALLPFPPSFGLREVHWFAAFWMVPLAGLHIGMNASRIGRFAGQALGLTLSAPLRLVLWAIGAGLAWAGLSSGAVLGLWPRLAFQYSLAMWDFNAAVLPFFLHWVAVLGLFVFAGAIVTRGLERVPVRAAA